jgi:hypothetical protein
MFSFAGFAKSKFTLYLPPQFPAQMVELVDTPA